MTERVKSLLEFLHASGSIPDEDARGDRQLDRLLEDLDGMLDISSLDSLARSFHKEDPRPSPHAEECNEMLKEVDLTRLSPLMVSSLVIFTSHNRTMLPAWYQMRDDAVVHLKEQLPDRWEGLLSGVLEYQP